MCAILTPVEGKVIALGEGLAAVQVSEPFRAGGRDADHEPGRCDGSRGERFRGDYVGDLFDISRFPAPRTAWSQPSRGSGEKEENSLCYGIGLAVRSVATARQILDESRQSI